MATDIPRIKTNISRMIDMGAPEADVDEYLKTENVTIDPLKATPPKKSPLPNI